MLLEYILEVCMFLTYTVYSHEIISFISLKKYAAKYFLTLRYNFIRPGVVSKPWGNFLKWVLGF